MKKHKLIQTSKEMTDKGPRMMGFYEDHKGETYAKPIREPRKRTTSDGYMQRRDFVSGTPERKTMLKKVAKNLGGTIAKSVAKTTSKIQADREKNK